MTSYVQLMCLAENIRTDFGDMQTLVEGCHGDLRHITLNLQFWAESGGGIQSTDKPVKYLPKFFANKKEGDEPQQSQNELTNILKNLKKQVVPILDSSMNSADDFTPVKRKGRRAARPIIDEDSEASLASPLKPISAIQTNLEDSQSGQDSPGPAGCFSIENSQGSEVAAVPSEKDLTTADITAPTLHQMCYMSATGCCNKELDIQKVGSCSRKTEQ